MTLISVGGALVPSVSPSAISARPISVSAYLPLLRLSSRVISLLRLSHLPVEPARSPTLSESGRRPALRRAPFSNAAVAFSAAPPNLCHFDPSRLHQRDVFFDVGPFGRTS